MQHDLLFREPAPSSRLEAKVHDEEMDVPRGDLENPEVSDVEAVEEFSWDELIIDDEEMPVMDASE
jgi:hypothetical protein